MIAIAEFECDGNDGTRCFEVNVKGRNTINVFPDGSFDGKQNKGRVLMNTQGYRYKAENECVFCDERHHAMSTPFRQMQVGTP